MSHTEISETEQVEVLIPLSSSNTIRPRHSIHYGLTQTEFDERYGTKSKNKNKTLCERARLEATRCCSKDGMSEFIRRRVPVIDVIRRYRWRKYLLGDILSGLSVGVMTIPQSLGYALLASVPAVVGLYTSFFPVIIYFFFSTSRHVSIGTMALSSLVISAAVQRGIGQSSTNQVAGNESSAAIGQLDKLHDVTSDTIDAQKSDGWTEREAQQILIAVSVSCLAGVLMMLMSVARLGFIVSYMSEAFISGYLASSNLRVIMHQVALILGIKPEPRGLVVGEFFVYVYDIVRRISETNLIQLLISVLTIALLILIKQCVNERFKNKIKVPIPIEVLVLALTTVLSYYLSLHSLHGVEVLGTVPRSLPAPLLPSPTLMLHHVFDALMLALVSFLLVAMMARLFSERHGYEVDCDQELMANGLACVGGSFFCSLAPSTSPPRCFLMESTGGKTQLSHLFSSVVVLLALCLIAPLFTCLPKCVLACVIVVACIPLFPHYSMWLYYYHTDPYDLCVWVVTCTANLLLSVDIGLIVGVAFSIVSAHHRMQVSHGHRLKCHQNDFIFTPTPQGTQGDKGGGVMIGKGGLGGGLNGGKGVEMALNDDFQSTLNVNDLNKTATESSDQVKSSEPEKNREQDLMREEGLEAEPVESDSLLVFRFSSPLYFATLDTFKRELYSHTLSLPRLKAEQVKREEARKRKGARKEVSFVQTRRHKTERMGEEKAGNNNMEQLGTGSARNHDVIMLSNHNDDNDDNANVCIVVDCSLMSFIDTGGAKLLAELYTEYKKVRVSLVLASCPPQTLQTLQRVKQCNSLLSLACYPSVHDAVMCTTCRHCV